MEAADVFHTKIRNRHRRLRGRALLCRGGARRVWAPAHPVQPRQGPLTGLAAQPMTSEVAAVDPDLAAGDRRAPRESRNRTSSATSSGRCGRPPVSGSAGRSTAPADGCGRGSAEGALLDLLGPARADGVDADPVLAGLDRHLAGKRLLRRLGARLGAAARRRPDPGPVYGRGDHGARP